MAKMKKIAMERLNEAAIALDAAISDMADEMSYAYALGFLLSQVLVVMEDELDVDDQIRVLEKITKQAKKKVGV